MIALRTLAGEGLLTAGAKVRVKVDYTIVVREVPGGKRITGSLRGPSVMLGAAWRFGRSNLVLQTGETLDVVVLSLIAKDLAPLEISAASAPLLLTSGRG